MKGARRTGAHRYPRTPRTGLATQREVRCRPLSVKFTPRAMGEAHGIVDSQDRLGRWPPRRARRGPDRALDGVQRRRGRRRRVLAGREHHHAPLRGGAECSDPRGPDAQRDVQGRRAPRRLPPGRHGAGLAHRQRDELDRVHRDALGPREHHLALRRHLPDHAAARDGQAGRERRRLQGRRRAVHGHGRPADLRDLARLHRLRRDGAGAEVDHARLRRPPQGLDPRGRAGRRWRDGLAGPLRHLGHARDLDRGSAGRGRGAPAGELLREPRPARRRRFGAGADSRSRTRSRRRSRSAAPSRPA